MLIPSVYGKIIRIEEAQGTLGVLLLNGAVCCYTLEPNDLLNRPFRSNIPEQQYDVELIVSPKHGKTYQVKNVPDRTYINFHSGNNMSDTEGCILLGMTAAWDNDKRIITDSVEAHSLFMKCLDGILKWRLSIVSNY